MDTPARLAVIVVPTGTVAAWAVVVKDLLSDPWAIVNEVGMAATAGFVFASVIRTPPDGAGNLSVTVPVTVCPSRTLVELRKKPLR